MGRQGIKCLADLFRLQGTIALMGDFITPLSYCLKQGLSRILGDPVRCMPQKCNTPKNRDAPSKT